MGTAGIEPAHSERTVLQTAAPHHLRRVPIAGTISIARTVIGIWSGWQDSNLRPRVPETRALPPELHPEWLVVAGQRFAYGDCNHKRKPRHLSMPGSQQHNKDLGP